MCGRYQTTKVAQEIEKIFDVKIDKKIYKQNYNAAPTQELPLIANNKPGEVQFFKWGLIPSWSKDEKMAFNMINARIETLNEKPSFKSLVKKTRCMVITDGYYEWKKIDSSTKQPMRICKQDESLFAYAGLWTEWKNSKGIIIPTFTIITTDPYQSLAEIHDRMPVMLNTDAAKAWLMNELEVEQLQKEMISQKDLKHYAVSKLVGSVKNNSPELLIEDTPTTLF